MGIRKIIAIGFGLIAVSAHAALTTNNWTYAGSSPLSLYWDATTSWSLGTYPTITNAADLITNSVTKTVLIDDFDTSSSDSNSLVVSNLTIGAAVNVTNTLLLFSMNDGTGIIGGLPIPLHILNGLTITNGGVLQVTNSIVQVDGRSGGTLKITGGMQLFDGALVLATNATISSSAVLWYALGSATTSSPVVVSNNLTLGGTLNVVDDGGFSNTTYTLFTYGGTLTYNGLTIGTTPPNFTCAISTSTVGQVNLVVTPGGPSNSAPFEITSIVAITNDVVITWTESGTGTNAVQAENGGSSGYNTNGFQDISGSIVLNGNTSTNYIDHGGATNSRRGSIVCGLSSKRLVVVVSGGPCWRHGVANIG